MTEAWAEFLRSCGADPEAAHGLFFAESAERCGELADGDTLCVAPLPERGVLEIAGADARRFLHGQSTCNVEQWTAGRGGSGAVCTPKGRVAANFALAGPTPERLLLTMPRSVIAHLQEFLKKYIVFSKAEQIDLSEEFFILGLLGGPAAQTAEQVFGATPGEGACTEIEGGVLLRRDANRIECLLSAARAPQDWRALCAADALPCGAAVWTLMDIRAGLAEVEGETVEAFVPQSLNLDCTGALDLHKGCYTGQEIIIRLQHRGKIKQRAHRLRGEAQECPPPGASLYAAAETRPCGTVLRAAPVAAQQWEMLAALPMSMKQPAQDLRLGAPDGVPLELLPLPYSTEL